MQIAIIGCGNMGRGLAQRLSKTHQLFLFDRHFDKAEKLGHEGYGIACKDINQNLISSAMVILAVKPQDLKEAAQLIGNKLIASQILVSLLSGTSIAVLKACFPNVQIVRMMPNLALMYGEGVIGLTSDRPNQELVEAQEVFEVLGNIYWLPENKMDALTALTGSGPAFFYVMIESMVDAGIAMGFSAKDAASMVQQMLHGSLVHLEASKQHPGELKWQIASPGGTTIAGLKKLEEEGLRGNIINTFLASYERALQLSSQLDAI
ncbi:MAG: pyrroline-5-carboxylate reductase [Candidatus Protochlamydia sp.]|nr:pyrroline-5-carboxylate reductase [Candidatus Protochlamydia sp.]